MIKGKKVGKNDFHTLNRNNLPLTEYFIDMKLVCPF